MVTRTRRGGGYSGGGNGGQTWGHNCHFLFCGGTLQFGTLQDKFFFFYKYELQLQRFGFGTIFASGVIFHNKYTNIGLPVVIYFVLGTIQRVNFCATFKDKDLFFVYFK